MSELLAPVGGRRQLEAAINNGADAVYMCGPLFNARIRAENFTNDDLQTAVDFAHERNVKVYITFNTLIKDSELQKAFDYACFLYEIGVDAIIIQDIGLARLIHTHIPDFPMHLSTQGTVYNTHALDLVRQLGFRRVVPARELTLEEIRRMCETAHADTGSGPLEIEVFVHGALCMCYSGQCQMSRLLGIGGGKAGDGQSGMSGDVRSGNRGLCAQPCRLPYTDDKGRTGFWLSPKDICTLERLPELIEAGVDSFKIEGRLKSAEYVATVTRIYRKYIDMYMETGGIKIAHEDMHDLTQIFNRGGFTNGYLDGNPGREILSGESSKNQGIFAGRICSISKEIKGKSRSKYKDKGKGSGTGKTLIDVRPADHSDVNIQMGDGVEIRGRRDTAEIFTTGNIVTYFKQLDDGAIRIGDFDKGIQAGDKIYKVTDKELNAKALSSAEKKLPLYMRFEAKTGEYPVLEIRETAAKAAGHGAPGPVRVKGDFVCEKALSKPTDRLRIEEQLSKLGDTPFEPADVQINIGEDIMIPVSVINHMRRDAVQRLLEEKHLRRDKTAGTKAELSPATQSRDGNIKAEVFAQLNMELVPLEEFMKDPEAGKLPYILNVSRGAIDEYIEKNFDEIVNAAKSTGIAIGNLGWVKQFLDAGVTVYGDYGLNAYNSECIKAYEDIGIKMIRMSHETADSAKAGIDSRFGGRIPLMITEHPLGTDYLIDRKGVKHDVIHLGDKHLIL